MSLNSKMNKMDVENLAITMTPNIMPITARKITHCGSLRVNQHIEILQVRVFIWKTYFLEKLGNEHLLWQCRFNIFASE